MPNIVWSHNPDRYATATLSRFWDTAHADATVTASGYNSTNGLTASSVNAYVRRFPRNFTGATTFALGGRLRISSLPSVRKLILAAADYDEAIQVGITLETDGKIKVWRGDIGDELAASTGALSTATWYKVGLRGTIGTIDGQAEVQIDGAEYDGTKISGANTQNSLVNGWHGIHVGLSSDLIWGHLYATTDDLVSGGYAIQLAPAADGTYTDWIAEGATDRYDCINESAPNDDTDFIKANAAGQKYSAQMATLSTTQSIYGVMQTAVVKNIAGGTLTAAHALLAVLESTDYQDDWQSASTSEWRQLQRWMPTNPRTGLPWTVAEINAARFGGAVVAG